MDGRFFSLISVCSQSGVASELSAQVAYTRKGRVEVLQLGQKQARDLGTGQFVRWGPKGEWLAVAQGSTLSLIRSDGSERRIIAKDLQAKDGTPMEFHPNGTHVLYLNKQKHFQAVDLTTGKTRDLKKWGTFTGEPCFSGDGKWLVAREGRTLWKVDTQTGHRTKFATGCSPMITSDSRFLMHNLGGHQRLAVLSTEGSPIKELTTQSQKPDKNWDNHHASNHPDYLAAQGEKGPVEAYIVRISDNRIWRATQGGRIAYPDVFVQQAPSQPLLQTTAKSGSDAKKAVEPIRLKAKLLARTPVPTAAELQEYRHALVADLYQPVQGTSSLPADQPIIVIRWAVKNRKPIPPSPPKTGGTHLLKLIPFAQTPELQSERLLDDVGEITSVRFFLLGVD